MSVQRDVFTDSLVDDVFDAIRNGDHAHRRLADDLFRGYLAPDQYDLAGGVVFTDDYNPVDYHDAANREGERRRMAMRMQR